MSDPIAYTYEADVHCPLCAAARFGLEPGHTWVADDARDTEGNLVGAIAAWDEWCEPSDSGLHVLACGTCADVIREHQHLAEADCHCDSCQAAEEYAEELLHD